MNDEDKTKERLIHELVELRRRIAELETSGGECKQIEEALAKVAAEQKNIMGTISDGIYMLDMSGNLVNWNKAAEVVTGLSAEELMDKPVEELFAEEDRASVTEAIRKGLREGIGEVTGSFLRKDRSPAIYQWSTVPLKNPQGEVIGLTGVGRDITEQKRIEEELARIAAEQKNIMGTISDGIYMLDMSGNLVNWNKAAEVVSGLSAEELMGKPIVELFAEEDRAAVAEAIRKGLKEGIGEVTGSFLRKGRTPAIYQWSTVPLKNPQGEVIGLTGVGRDITKRKQAEKALKESNETFQQVVSNITTVVWKASIGKNGMFEDTYISPVIDELLELPAGTMKNDWDRYFGYIKPEYLEQVNNSFREAMISLKKPIACEYEVLKENGQTAWFYSNGRCFEKNGKLHVFGSTLNITERKQAEEARQESEEQLQTLIDAMPDFICFKDRDGRWLKVNNASIRIFRLEGIDYRGKKDSELAELCSHLRGAFLTCKETDARAWKEGGLFHGEEMVSHPDGIVRVFDVLKVPVFYPSGERKGLVVLGRDITERKRAEEALRLQLITLAETVSRIFNLRNPYVATHQQETAELARAVGEKMGLDEDTLQNLYIGSLLHDIGKTAIPEGILRKPGKLTEAELGLVRTHPRQGYDILKDANLPSLVAELVLHHHERLDGSGYPDGLKGDELSMEVRILAVCNVVNAMSLRHPYRPARSKQEITKEITNGKGTKYDPEVVDVLIGIIESGELELAG